MRLCDQRNVPSNPAWPQKVTLVFFILINLVVPGLSGGMWDLFQLPHAGSSSLTGLNLSPLRWEYRVLDPAPPGNPSRSHFGMKEISLTSRAGREPHYISSDDLRENLSRALLRGMAQASHHRRTLPDCKGPWRRQWPHLTEEGTILPRPFPLLPSS